MSGPMRQPIDVASLENYIYERLPRIQRPIQVNQVRSQIPSRLHYPYSQFTVWIRPIQSHLPDPRCPRPEIRYAQETARRNNYEKRAQDRT